MSRRPECRYLRKVRLSMKPFQSPTNGNRLLEAVNSQTKKMYEGVGGSSTARTHMYAHQNGGLEPAKLMGAGVKWQQAAPLGTHLPTTCLPSTQRPPQQLAPSNRSMRSARPLIWWLEAS